MAQPVRTRSRRVVAVGVALAALSTLAAALTACGSGPTYSLDEALKPDTEKLGTSFQTIISYDDQQSQVSGGIDPAGTHARMKLDLGGGLFGSAPIEAVVDLPNSVIYMKSDFFKALGTAVTAEWVKVDKAALDAAGEDTTFFDQLQVDDPRTTTSLFAKATTVKDLGMAELPDEDPMRHYEVTVKSSDVVASNPSLSQTLDNIEGTLPDTIVYDVYVTKKNAIRYVTFTLDLEVTTLKSEVWIDENTSPVAVDVPAEADTVNVLELTGPTPTTP